MRQLIICVAVLISLSSGARAAACDEGKLLSTETRLILYLAGSGMTEKPVRVTFPTMQACPENADR